MTARGRGTNTVGAIVARQGGLVLSLERMKKVLELMRAIKRQFDPHGILNPGKPLPPG